ncbi:MAG: leucine--tRNA ligase, partial [Planctomycetes bacterium]|nr:leucine--tRNA ligase [Planctomycetota bacterium]
SVLAMQEEWIGKSRGATVNFKVKETGDDVPVFTTRPDTLWGVTYMSIAPEHPLVEKLVKGTPREAEVMAAVKKMRAGGTSEKELAEREKEGVFTGFHVVNPVNGEEAPLWVANFALMTYGTGAVMSVPAHDQRDFEFAKKYDLPIKAVIFPEGGLDEKEMAKAYVDKGEMKNSGPFTGENDNFGAIEKIIDWLDREGKGKGKGTVNYRLRDWLLSRQRYWGAPIPVIYCDDCGVVPVPEKDLPVLLPTDVEFKEGHGNPLASSESFVNCKCPKCGKDAKRETDTMDTFVDSSWYFLRYCDSKNDEKCFDPEIIKKLMPVDQYIGGIEHATMHLIYARFYTMVLHDLGLVDFTEPFERLFCQGMVCKTAYFCEKCKWLPETEVEFADAEAQNKTQGKVGKCKKCGKDGVTAEMTKISKSKLNIVDPDAMFDKYGTDCVRLYMLSDAPPDRMQIWAEDGINGAWRTLNRLWTMIVEKAGSCAPVDEAMMPTQLNSKNRDLRRKTHQCIQRVTESIEGGFQFNTAIARCNELLNMIRAFKKPINPAVLREVLETVVRIVSPIVPHFAEECWERLGRTESIFTAGWPEADAAVAAEEAIEIPVQVNGKLRSRIKVKPDESESSLRDTALADEKVKASIEGKEIVKVIVVPGRMVNIAAKG